VDPARRDRKVYVQENAVGLGLPVGAVKADHVDAQT
jgi:hypothetical protein